MNTDWRTLYEKDFGLYEVFMHSGVRPQGRTVDNSRDGRSRHCFLYISEGRVEFRQEGTAPRYASSGSLVFIGQGCRYVFRYDAPSTLFCLINFRIRSCGGESVQIPEIRIFPPDQTFEPGAVFERFVSFRDEATAVGQFRLKEAVYRLLRLIAEENGANLSPEDERFAQIRAGYQLLTQQYTKDIPIPQIARECSISESLFRSLFRECFGVSPVQYRNQMRIRRSRQLLQDHDCTVLEAALAVGFKSESYFSRIYKKNTGVSPKNDERNPPTETVRGFLCMRNGQRSSRK